MGSIALFVNICSVFLNSKKKKTKKKMDFVSDMTNNSLDDLNSKDSALKTILLLVGLYYTVKFILKIFFNFFNAFKTFVFPMIWSQDFLKSYGSWAGDYKYIYTYYFDSTGCGIQSKVDTNLVISFQKFAI